MTESTFSNAGEIALQKKAVEQNFKTICANMAAAAQRSGRDPKTVTLLAATKTVCPEVINYAIELGVPCIGENRVQEFLQKLPQLQDGARRDFIGHLQTNKVKDIVGKVAMIHSVHSLKLAREVGKVSEKLGLNTPVLLEVNLAGEESKSGFLKEQLPEALPEIAKIKGITVRGLMAIPPICENNEKNRPYFKELHKLFVDIGTKKIDNIYMEHLSMGMSDDYETAIEEGATIIRVGTALFGRRVYQ